MDKNNFSQKLAELTALAAVSENKLQMTQVLDAFAKEQVTPEEMELPGASEINNQNYVKAYGSKGAMATDDYEIRLAYTGGSVNTSYVNDPRWIQPGYGDLMAIDWQDEVFRLAPKQKLYLVGI